MDRPHDVLHHYRSKGRYHYLGGRFIPPSVRDKFQLQLPAYPGASVCVKLDSTPNVPKVHRNIE